MSPTSEIAIIGAGAAGLATAIFTGRLNPHLRVLALDGAKRPGAKILVSGGTRCNVTNASVRETDFDTDGSRATVRHVLRALPVPETIAWFQSLGVTLHEEESGKLFPDTNRARDVLEALLREASRAGVELRTEARVTHVGRAGDAFQLTTAQGLVTARAVVLATGGRSLPKTGSDGAGYALATGLGHSLVPTCPALAPLVVAAEHSLHPRLRGVAHDVELTVWIDGRVARRFTGPALWTHFGLSGPVALDASRHVERAQLSDRRVRVTISFLPSQSLDQVDRHLATTAAARPRAGLRAALAGTLPASVADALGTALELEPSLALSRLPRERRRAVARALVEWEVAIVGSRGFAYAEATAGGVRLDEVNPKTMESRVCPGLYLVGEILDVDGRLGGFNFQWAWASARVAAQALARRGAGSARGAALPAWTT